MLRAVVDTNVIYAAIYSDTGSSQQLLQLLKNGKWRIVLSNTLCAEYEEVLLREKLTLDIKADEIEEFLNGMCSMAERHLLTTPWTPVLNDPDDEAQVHLAYEAKVDYIVTHNMKHLDPARKLGIAVITPGDFLKLLKNQP
jgi:putative PIN family toxin of toxin-antitoxin system